MYLLRAKEKADKEAAEDRKKEKRREKKKRQVKRHQRKYEEYVDLWTDAVFSSSYLGSFEVATRHGEIDKFEVKTSIKEMSQYSGTGQSAQITLSLEGIEVLDKETDTIKMAHALARIQYMAAHPTEPIVGFVAKNPKVDERFCHCFELKKRKRAQQIHKRLRRALKIFAMENTDPNADKEKRNRRRKKNKDAENKHMKDSIKGKDKRESRDKRESKTKDTGKKEKRKSSAKHKDRDLKEKIKKKDRKSKDQLYDNNYDYDMK